MATELQVRTVDLREVSVQTTRIEKTSEPGAHGVFVLVVDPQERATSWVHERQLNKSLTKWGCRLARPDEVNEDGDLIATLPEGKAKSSEPLAAVKSETVVAFNPDDFHSKAAPASTSKASSSKTK